MTGQPQTPAVCRYIFALDAPRSLSASDGYRLWAWLLGEIGEENAAALHDSTEKPFSHGTYYDAERKGFVWKICLLSREMCGLFMPVLDRAGSVRLGRETVGLTLVERSSFACTAELVRELSAPGDAMLVRLHFLTPTAFKSRGEYVIFPEVHQIVRSLVGRWNSLFPDEAQLADMAVPLMTDVLRIRDYDLRTCRFGLKDSKVPGFTGSVLLMPVPQGERSAELIGQMLGFAEYAGVGIKTALGMGCVSVTR